MRIVDFQKNCTKKLYEIKEEDLDELRKVDFPYRYNYVILKERGVTLSTVKEQLKKRINPFIL